MSLNYVKSSKGNDLLVYSGYIFEKDYMKKQKTYWKCIRYNTDKCRGRAHTKNNEVSFHKDDLHNHTPNNEEIGVKKCISQIKEMSNQIESSVNSTTNFIFF